MSDDGTCIHGTLAQGELPESDPLEQTYRHSACGSPSEKAEGFIALIENRMFLRECIRHSMQSAFSIRIVAHSTVLELEHPSRASPELVILSFMEANEEAIASALKILLDIVPGIPVIVLSDVNDSELARTAACHGAKGYIPVTMGFETAIAAVRFVLTGGTYVPMDCFLGGRPSVEAKSCQPPSALTVRELGVIRAIQQGKSNKVIAYKLKMCESTVKVHLRNVMKKLKAKNRTEVAIKAKLSLPALLPSRVIAASRPDRARLG